MYEPIQMTATSSQVNKITDKAFIESCTLFPKESTIRESMYLPWEIFNEAVFSGGRERIMPVINAFQKVKDTLEGEIKKNGSKFNPKAFWSNIVFRDLEASVINVFGFRDVNIEPWQETYSKKSDDFSTKMLNCFTWVNENARFPVEALVTDKGFYDSTHTLRTTIVFTLGIVRACSAEELTAIFIHEIGHNIDPALVDIQYTETNILSKYLTDREGAITPQEKKVIEKKGLTPDLIISGIFLLLMGIMWLVEFIRRKLFNPDKAIEKIRQIVQRDPELFTRHHNIEAFADNFARMYGMGGALMSGLQKIWVDQDKQMKRVKKEKERQMAITDLTKMMISDVHKTDIHRIYNLIREYEKDIADPNIPKPVKKQLQDDLNELKTVLDWHLNKRDKFQNRVNKVIYEELLKADTPKETNTPVDKEKPVVAPSNESVEDDIIWFDEHGEYFEEGAKKKSEKIPLTEEERKQVKARFGDSIECSFARDSKGYFAYTHRARTKSYETIDKLPLQKVEFVRSTS